MRMTASPASKQPKHAVLSPVNICPHPLSVQAHSGRGRGGLRPQRIVGLEGLGLGRRGVGALQHADLPRLEPPPNDDVPALRLAQHGEQHLDRVLLGIPGVFPIP